MKNYISHANWPKEANLTDNHSEDGHDTYSAAYAVCKALEREGLGGEMKIFPTKTWVHCCISSNIQTSLTEEQIEHFRNMPDNCFDIDWSFLKNNP